MVGSEPGPSDLIYFRIFTTFTAEPQRLPKRQHFLYCTLILNDLYERSMPLICRCTYM
jgi:hypothetical protein